MVLFYNKHTDKTLVQNYAAEEKICVNKIEPSLLQKYNKKPLLFALTNDQITDVTALCSRLNCTDVSILSFESGDSAQLIRVDVSKPRLDYLEMEIARICNLYCRGCSAFIQLADHEQPFYDLSAFVRDLKQVKTKFWGVEKIRLMGGEPLLANDIAAYVEHARNIFPDADMRIVTNGLLIPTLSAETLARLKQNGCTFDISNYPPTQRMKKEIISVLRNAKITFDFGPPVRFFLKIVSAQPSGDVKSAFDNCICSYCHMMNQGGILFPCSFAYCIRRFNRHFDTSYSEGDFLDLYQTEKDGWEILDWLSKPYEFCGNCSAGMLPIRWRNGVHKDDAVKGDWIVPKNVWTDHFIPFAQRLAIPGVKMLRSFMQNKRT